jgi:hypothetical protein
MIMVRVLGMIDWLFTVPRPAEEFFTDMETSPLQAKRWKIYAFARSSGPLFIVPHLLWHGASVFRVSSKGPPHLVASYNTQEDPHGSWVQYENDAHTHCHLKKFYNQVYLRSAICKIANQIWWIDWGGDLLL